MSERPMHDVYEECGRCKGAGSVEDEDGRTIICPRCDATGYVPHDCQNAD